MRTVLILALTYTTYTAQTVNLEWAKQYVRYSDTHFSGSGLDSKYNAVLSSDYYYHSKWFKNFSATDIHKFDALGNQIWADTSSAVFSLYSGGLAIDKFDNIYKAVYVSNQEGIYFDGQYYGPANLYLLKYAPTGKLTWAKPVGGTEAEHLYIDNNSFLYIAGRGYLKKMDLDGNAIFTVPSSGGVSVDGLGNICMTDKICDKNGNLIRAFSNMRSRICDLQGNVYSFFSDTLVKYDQNDKLIWTRLVPKINKAEFASTMTIDGVNLYIATGTIDSSTTHLITISFDTNGAFRWQYDHIVALDKYAYEFRPRNISARNGHVLVSGSYGLEYDCGIALKFRESNAQLVGINKIDSVTKLQVYPNPGRKFLVKGDLSSYTYYRVLDATGKLVKEQSISNFDERFLIDLTDLPKGVYMLSVFGKDSTQHHKLLVD